MITVTFAPGVRERFEKICSEWAERVEAAIAAYMNMEVENMNGDMAKLTDEFKDKITPKNADAETLFLFKCTCGGVHYRHAGYVEALMPFVRADGTKNVGNESYHVMVCVACRRSYIWLNEQMYEVTDMIDLEAWAKAEKELHEATGPGGQC